MKEERTNNIIVKLISKEINTKQASRLLGLSERQVYRKKKRYLTLGIKSIPHGLKTNPSKKGYSNELKQKILKLYLDEYYGWNFQHFNDVLEDEYNIKVSDSFIYNLFTKNNIESPYKYKQSKKTHPPRPRRENAGELIQVDASKHQWLDGDEEFYHLHGAIDDATGIVTSCFLNKEETIFGYQMILKDTIEKYGIPECLYTDYRTIFKSSKKELTLDEELEGKQINNTRFANMLDRLGVDIISTLDPKAKGRIERLWRTFQDRLYKELKFNNINSIEKANLYIQDTFLPKYNSRFAFQIDYTRNSFVSIDKSFDFNKELAIWSEHKVYHNSYLRFNKQYFIIMKDNQKVFFPQSGNVKVYIFLDQTKHIVYKDNLYDLKPVKEVNNKPIEYIKPIKSQEEINRSKAHKPNPNHPWISYGFNSLKNVS